MTHTRTAYVAYYRVSTTKQGATGHGMEAQRAAVLAFLAGNSPIAEFVEVESGKRSDRPQLAQALAACRRHKATLVIAKLDRLARNVAFIANLMEAGADFVAVDMPNANRLTLHIMAAMAEHEREMISQRTKAALAAAKARGAVLGNRTNLAEAQAKGGQMRSAQADDFSRRVFPVLNGLMAQGVSSLRALACALNERGIASPRGGQWHPSAVRNVVRRMATEGQDMEEVARTRNRR